MIEIQFQPADIRKQVTYCFLLPHHVAWLTLALLAAVAVVATAAVFAPETWASFVMIRDARTLATDTANEQVRMKRLTGTLEGLERRTERDRSIAAQLDVVLGVPSQESFSGGARAASSGVDSLENELLRRSDELRVATHTLLAQSDETQRFLTRHQGLAREVPSICPLPEGSFVLSSPFGQRTSPFTGAPDFHPGIDLAARQGTPVTATGDGRVVYAGRVPVEKDVRWWRFGNIVMLSHGARYLTLYAHLDRVMVARDGAVRRGDTLGAVGNTGWSTSAHLHYEVQRIDPDVADPIALDPRIFILNHEWQGREAWLVAARTAPPPAYEPLPSLVTMR